MKFIGSNKEIRKYIERNTIYQSGNKPILIAVAYWGQGIESVIDDSRKYQIICNLSDGGTNPKVIEALIEKNNIEIKQLERLHAKAFITEKSAIVGSANFSKNGLGLDECEGTIEVALQTDETKPLIDWFNKQWEAARDISNEDIVEAMTMYDVKKENYFKSLPPKPESDLNEYELFEDEISTKNETRMASEKIAQFYYKIESIEDTRYAVRIPAHAANLIWVASGKTIKTNIIECRVFKHTSEVIERMMKKRMKTEKKVLPLLDILSKEKIFSRELRYWAGIAYIELNKAISKAS
ncbi:MAG: hypothetical protein HAW67_06190 [Endozoicomonadaceae bacterium]|nr:hypothetical protein [Endozoicomonadaceae bacterium]